MSVAQSCGARQRARAVRGVTEGRWFDLKAGKGGSRGKKSRPESRQYAINGIAVHGQSDSGEAGLTVRRGVHEGCQRDARGTTS